jgi:hypothetical protein
MSDLSLSPYKSYIIIIYNIVQLHVFVRHMFDIYGFVLSNSVHY